MTDQSPLEKAITKLNDGERLTPEELNAVRGQIRGLYSPPYDYRLGKRIRDLEKEVAKLKEKEGR